MSALSGLKLWVAVARHNIKSLKICGAFMVKGFRYRIKLEELSILSCEKGSRLEAEAFFTAKNGEPRGF